MSPSRPASDQFTLMLRTADGGAWPLTMSADCLRFVGRYRRLQGFGIDARSLFEDVRRLS